jgi:hypothetical protein
MGLLLLFLRLTQRKMASKSYRPPYVASGSCVNFKMSSKYHQRPSFALQPSLNCDPKFSISRCTITDKPPFTVLLYYLSGLAYPHRPQYNIMCGPRKNDVKWTLDTTLIQQGPAQSYIRKVLFDSLRDHYNHRTLEDVSSVQKVHSPIFQGPSLLTSTISNPLLTQSHIGHAGDIKTIRVI